MKKFKSLLKTTQYLCVLGTVCQLLEAATSTEPDDSAFGRPNIIVMMVDDMGYSDIGCYGGEIQTPNIDALARGGLQFTQFYNTGRCCPTRASLMTGLHPHQAGIGHMTETPAGPSPMSDHPYQGFLNEQCVTIAEVLKKAGYSTLMTGKWHLGYHDKNNWPLQRGFEKYFGIISGASHFMNPQPPRGLTLMNEPFSPGPGFYTTDAFTDYAMQFIRESTDDSDKPFFLYLAYNAPHWPLHAKSDDLAKYEGKYRGGWHALIEKRLERQRAMGLIDPSWEPAPHEGPEWKTLDEETRHLLDLRMAAYAACIDSVDQNIGRLVAFLKHQGMYENTLLLFLSDNGACQEGGILGSGSEASVRDPLSSQGTAGPRCGQAWANASNTPFRYYKHFVHEGGMSTPLVAHWPAGIPWQSRGAFVRQLGYLPDFMSTFIELAGAEYPEKRHDIKVHPMAGKSLVPLFKGVDHPVHETPVYWEHEGNRAMRDGKWKLAWSGKGPWELYDMESDRTEMHDLSRSEPDRLNAMIQKWESWAKGVGVSFPEPINYYKTFNQSQKKKAR
jgi:arylsulfatase A-like enzyme